MAGVAASQFPIVLWRAKHFAHRHVDTLHRDRVAGVSADGSAWLLGIVGFCGQIPTFLLAPFAGVWVDRLNRRHVLVVTQTLAMVQSLVLAALTLTHVVTIAEILWLSIFQGMINAFDMPGRQAFMVQMIEDRQDLGNAIALNSSMVNMARLVGPSLAGLVIAGFGEGYCFLIDGISYIAVIVSLLLMKLPKFVAALQVVPMLEQLKEGWRMFRGSLRCERFCCCSLS